MKLFIVLHHSADDTQGPQFDKIERSHKARGFPKGSMGYHVGYHWFIGFDGTMKQARKEEERGAHCSAKMMNTLGIGVCLAGNFTKDFPNPAQIDALEELLTGIQERWSLDEDAILLHRECKATSCPGKDLRGLALLRRRKLETEGRLVTETNPSLRRALQRRLTRIVRWMGGV